MNQTLNQALKIIALTLSLVFLIAGYMTISAKRTQPAPVTPSPTETVAPTDTSVPNTATATKQPTATETATHTQTPSPTASSTASATFTPTLSPTAQISATATNTATPLPTDTATAIFTATAEITNTADLTSTLPAEPTATETPAGPPTETPTPTVTPTPVPRTVLADTAPDFSQATPHFWFVRPFAEEFDTHGSWFYPYGTNNNGEYLWHKGIDIQNEAGTPILAVGDGVVVFADSDNARAIGPQTDFYGQAVAIQHSNSWPVGEENLPVYTLYGHVSELLVNEGETVTTGQPIALTGQEGVALGPHLHFEVRLGDNNYLATQNPDLWIRSDAGQGAIAGRVVDINGFYVPQQLITLHRAAEPNRFYRQTRTYPDHRFQFDPQLGETFTFADVPAGDYIIKTSFDGRNYDIPVSVINQESSFVLILGEAPPPPTPAATPTPTASPETAPPAETATATPEG